MARTGRKRKPRITLPGRGGVRFVEREMLSPYDKTRRDLVKMAVRDNTLEQIALAGHLKQSEWGRDATDARMEAAKRFLAASVAAQGSGASAIDYSREKVDISFRYDGTPESQAVALRELAGIEFHIGKARREILDRTIMEELAVHLQIKKLRRRNERAYAFFYSELRAALDGVADFYGTARGKVTHKSLVSHETIY